jgi:Gpi18-like mannosyltransferase
MFKTNTKKELLFILVFFTGICFLLPLFPGHESDNHYWRNWASHIKENGLRNAYTSGTNYLPCYQYILWLFGKLAGSIENIDKYLVYLRSFTLFFDFIGLWFVYKWSEGRIPLIAVVFINIVNISYSYNTVVWGQVDGIMATLIFISLYFGFRKKPLLSTIFFVLALNMKLQCIIFLPIFGLVLLQYLLETKKWKQLFSIAAVILVTQIILLFPFFKNNNTLPLVWNVVTTSVDAYPKVSMNAFNFWYLVMDQNPWDTNDSNIFIAGLSYKKTGLILFFLASFVALLPLLIPVYKRLFLKTESCFSKQQLWLSAGLTAILFFYFNSQMHERYCHPAFIFLAAYTFYSKKLLHYLLFSVAYFLNMDGVLQSLFPGVYDIFVFKPIFIAALFSILLLLLYLEVFKNFKSVDPQRLN